jgi:hypothetical protein
MPAMQSWHVGMTDFQTGKLHQASDFSNGADTQLARNIGTISLHRALGNSQLFCDGFQWAAVPDQCEHFEFTTREHIQRAEINQAGIKHRKWIARGSLIDALPSNRNDPFLSVYNRFHRPDRGFHPFSTANMPQNNGFTGFNHLTNHGHSFFGKFSSLNLFDGFADRIVVVAIIDLSCLRVTLMHDSVFIDDQNPHTRLTFQ